MIRNLQLAVAGDDTARSRAMSRLLATPGLEDVALDGNGLSVTYDLRETSCAHIIDQIEALGIPPDLTWQQRLRLRLRCYREAVLTEDRNNEIGWDSFVREIYVSRYRHRRHGRRDDRPRHWRQYSASPQVGSSKTEND
jgi:hypothetical protein